MNNTNEKIYSEVDGLLNSVSEEYRLKIPKKLRDFFEKNKDFNYNVIYDISKPLYDQNISKKALSIIALLHINYWCKNEEEKQNLMKTFNQVSIEKEEEKRRLYPTDNIFKSKKNNK